MTTITPWNADLPCRRTSLGECVARGFTLIELLIALAIAGIIMLSLYSSLYIGFKARDSAMNALMPAQAANVAMDLIRNDLEAAQPVRELLCAGFTGSDNYDGNGNDSLTFYTTSEAPPHD